MSLKRHLALCFVKLVRACLCVGLAVARGLPGCAALPGALECCCPPANPASVTWGNRGWGAPLPRLGSSGRMESWRQDPPSLGSMAGSPVSLQASRKQEPLSAVVAHSPACLAKANSSFPGAELPASGRSAVTRLRCLCSQGFLPTPGTASQWPVGELIFSGPCTRCSLPISTFSSCSVPAGAGPCGPGTLVPTAAVPPVCGVNREPLGRHRALQNHSFSDRNKLVDFACLAEITEMKKLLMRMTDGGPNDQTA